MKKAKNKNHRHGEQLCITLANLSGHASGAVQEGFVIRRVGSRIILTPHMVRRNKKFTENQLETQRRFKEASAYASAICADPETKAIHAKKSKGTKAAYLRAMTEYLRRGLGE